MSQSMFYASAFNVMAADDASPLSGSSPEPDPSIRGSVRVTPNMPSSGDGSTSMPLPVEVVVRDGGVLEVHGFLSMASCQQAVDVAVAAATPAPETVLPSGFAQATTRDEAGAITLVRFTMPGGRWVEFDPIANTFRV